MEKIIIYGAGSRFERQEKNIEKKYEIVGISGKNEVNHSKYMYISPIELHKHEYDYLVITSSFQQEIINYLVDEIEIPIEKIVLDEVLLEQCSIFNGQYSEDAIVLNLLNLLHIDIPTMTYLELGTNRPIAINNTYLFYRMGARGVLVEPNPEMTNLIKCVRPEDRLIVKAVDITKGNKKTFYQLHSQALSTLDIGKINEDAATNISKSFEVDDMFDVETITINDIFESMQKMPTLLAMDIEGLDYEVLKTIDFDRFRPRIILAELEAWGAKEQEGDQIIDFLTSNGYEYINVNPVNGIFVNADDFKVIKNNIFARTNK